MIPETINYNFMKNLLRRMLETYQSTRSCLLGKFNVKRADQKTFQFRRV